MVMTKPECPECGSSNAYYRKTSESWRCRKCKHEFQSGSDAVQSAVEPSGQLNSETSAPDNNSGKKSFMSWLGSIFGSGKK
ncbi:MAG: hypothetical protein VX966_07380 [Chloroflexota bacterium]|nr:hypothetical protein [Chloroflexota bacterium]